jgi:hypothetical protein
MQQPPERHQQTYESPVNAEQSKPAATFNLQPATSIESLDLCTPVCSDHSVPSLPISPDYSRYRQKFFGTNRDQSGLIGTNRDQNHFFPSQHLTPTTNHTDY